MNCQNCAAKDATILRQQKEILRLQRIIQQAQAACAAVDNQANQVLSHNQPRGTWSFARGTKKAVQVIAKFLAC